MFYKLVVFIIICTVLVFKRTFRLERQTSAIEIKNKLSNNCMSNIYSPIYFRYSNSIIKMSSDETKEESKKSTLLYSNSKISLK